MPRKAVERAIFCRWMDQNGQVCMAPCRTRHGLWCHIFDVHSPKMEVCSAARKAARQQDAGNGLFRADFG